MSLKVLPSVDESAITGESAPVIRESGGDRSAVTGGTTVVSDYLVIRVTSENGHSFLDKMISMVEGTQRKKTPNEIGLQIFSDHIDDHLFSGGSNISPIYGIKQYSFAKRNRAF